jgi:hypothetical protein
MKQFELTSGQRRRLEKIRELARRMGNMSLAPVQSHLNPYRDLSPSQLTRVEAAIRNAFMEALPEQEIPVLLWANGQARSFLSLEFAQKQSSRGNLLRLLTTSKKWFEKNWELFADDLGSEARRDIFVFLRYDKTRLSRLVAPWWDPNVLMNPSITSSPSLLREVKARLRPGTIAFALAMAGLRSCELYFHPNDLEIVTESVCTSAHKQDWWTE